MNARVVVLTKVAEPGRVKTRLAPLIGEEGAAAVHRAMVTATLDLVAASGLPTWVALAGDTASAQGRAACAELEARGVPWFRQAGGDLGARMAHALCLAAPPVPARSIALGTDCPIFEPAWLARAAASDAPVAVGPSDDGGYWTISIDTRREGVAEAVFAGIAWSSADVLARTLQRASAAGLAVEQLARAYDVDEPADLLRLRADPRCPVPLSALLSRLLA